MTFARLVLMLTNVKIVSAVRFRPLIQFRPMCLILASYFDITYVGI